MNRARFLATRQGDWYRFRELLDHLESTRLKHLGGGELSEFSRLFRSLCYDLAVVRSRDWGGELEGRLNDLVVRGHNLLYRAPPGRFQQALEFVMVGFPRLLRAELGYFWTALALFVIPGAIAGLLVSMDPELASRLLPEAMQRMMEEMHSTDHADRALFAGGEAARTGFYVLNNVGIAFKCWVLGILLGVGTIYILVFNSLVLGTVTGYLIARGHTEPFFSFVIAHGSFELTAIVVAGAAGLVLGRALVHPGPYRRMDALRRRGLVSVKLALGAAVMLVVAALIEGIWSPMGLPAQVKLTAGAGFWLLMLAYLVLGGRRFGRSARRASRQDASPDEAEAGEREPGASQGAASPTGRGA
jgi:uncharacterized membrane protein SpoIIM required for sporulation